MLTRKEIGLLFGITIRKDKDKGCWFINNRDWSNYSSIEKRPAHRVIYELCVGPIIPGRYICHTCDRKGCVCPGHLFQGTASDNQKDARRKGRSHWHRYSIEELKSHAYRYRLRCPIRGRIKFS